MTERTTSDLLQEWRLDSTPPANFDSAVWRRIEARQPLNFFAVFGAWLSDLFSRPTVAVSYVMGALVLGIAAGQVHSSRQLQSAEFQAKAKYIQTIDPYAQRIAP